MRIRGTLKPMCSLCAYANNNAGLMCEISKAETDEKDSCPKFKYDIFKYCPSDKNDLGRFSKEDFEI